VRVENLRALSSQVFDVLVIGGGITGAGIARDAALRGYSVALIDKGDFAGGTSSRSSRLIHGGVRYLEHGHLHLVFEAQAERRRLLRLAPHLVQPLAFTWPVYPGQRLPLWKLAAGLTLYDLLSLFRNVRRHRTLDAKEVLRNEPALRRDGLRGGVRYFDASTNDARLTLANVLDARVLGAVAANYVKFVGTAASRGGGRVARVEDTLANQPFEIRAKVFVNASGPWSDDVHRLDGDVRQKTRVQGSKGAHIAVLRDRIGNRDAVTMLHPRDGRVLFALPAGQNAIIGTTDTFTDVSPDEVRASEADVAYLLDAANTFFPGARLMRDDVIAAWAGIRPLMPTSKSEGAASREHSIERRAAAITITGGKLTTYRVMAAQVVNVLHLVLSGASWRKSTRNRPLPASQPPETGAEISPGLPYRMDAMRWSVDNELACTLGDLLIRRTHVAFETRDNGRTAARAVAAALGWGTDQLERYDAEAGRIFSVDP